MDWSSMAIAIGVFGVFGVLALITGALAKRKGYRFLPWFFAGLMPIISLLVLCFLPFANDAKVPESEQVFRTERGDRIGRNLAIVVFVLTLIRCLSFDKQPAVVPDQPMDVLSDAHR